MSIDNVLDSPEVKDDGLDSPDVKDDVTDDGLDSHDVKDDPIEVKDDVDAVDKGLDSIIFIDDNDNDNDNDSSIRFFKNV